MKIIKVNFASHFLFPPFVYSEVLYERCDLAESVDFNAGTLSGLFDLLLADIRSTAEVVPSCFPELGSFNLYGAVGEDVFELNIRVLFNKEEHIRKDMHSRVFDRLRAVLYTEPDFEKREFSESYTDYTKEGK